MPNHLAQETSPYLQQHRDNPVDWYPWGDEALERAKVENKAIFLSIGYSACHWCHVMAHESFEDDETAAIMNEHFINIKVDREERPDVDSIYMTAVQAISGGGGWPMSVWLLPDGRPFYGGTYYPDAPRHGMPSFKQVLRRVAEVFATNRDTLERDAANLTRAISRRLSLDDGQSQALDTSVLDAAFQSIASTYDREWGGFDTSPKFPPGMTLEFLMRLYHRNGWQQALTMVTHTLDRMMWGGMCDQIGGGFHRYSVDNRWLVPHFEKMLYDNALLIRAYAHAYQITQEARYQQVVEQTIEYVRREMTALQGGFYSTQDADSERHEGKFFVWREDELRTVLESIEYLDALLDYWGVGKGPNFEGQNILWVPDSVEEVAERHEIEVGALLESVSTARRLAFDHREERIKPGRDEKILTAWNGLMIASIAEAGRIFDRPDYIRLAENAALFIWENMYQEGRLLRSYKEAKARFNAYLEDYSFYIRALLELYQSTFALVWFERALELAERMIALFWDDDAGFYDTSYDHEELVARPQDVTDGATPSGTSVAVGVLLRLSIMADRGDWRNRAERILKRLAPSIQAYPRAFGNLACQLDFALSEVHEIAVAGDSSSDGLKPLLEIINQPYRPNQVVALRGEDGDAAEELIPLLVDRVMVDGKVTVYVCRNFVCRLPVVTPDALARELEESVEV